MEGNGVAIIAMVVGALVMFFFPLYMLAAIF